MSNKKLSLILLIISGVLIVGFGVFKLTSSTTTKTVQLSSDGSVPAQEDGVKGQDLQGAKDITLIEVQKHNSKTDCWTIITGSVYDITDYIPRHPGGDEILRVCGADGTQLFTSRTTDEGEKVGSGATHSGNAAAKLNDFFIGNLVENQ